MVQQRLLNAGVMRSAGGPPVVLAPPETDGAALASYNKFFTVSGHINPDCFGGAAARRLRSLTRVAGPHRRQQCAFQRLELLIVQRRDIQSPDDLLLDGAVLRYAQAFGRRASHWRHASGS